MEKAGTFEYEIRKDFRNNQIVREVDERRLRDLWQSLAIGAALVIVLLFSAWQHFELLRHGYKLEQMQRERSAEIEINHHLRLENETLRAPQRIEKDRLALSLSRLRNVYSDNLIEVTEWCMSLDPLSRPQSVFALQKELSRETERQYTKLSFSERLKLQLENLTASAKA